MILPDILEYRNYGKYNSIKENEKVDRNGEHLELKPKPKGKPKHDQKLKLKLKISLRENKKNNCSTSGWRLSSLLLINPEEFLFQMKYIIKKIRIERHTGTNK